MSFDFELIDSDIKIKADGTVRTVSDTPKLRQDVLKIILTPLGSNKYHKWYGCSVGEDIIGKNLPDNMIVNDITTSISNSLKNLQTLQNTQVTYQKTSMAERIAAIGEVFAERNPADLRQINVIVSVLTKRMTKVEEMFTLIS